MEDVATALSTGNNVFTALSISKRVIIVGRVEGRLMCSFSLKMVQLVFLPFSVRRRLFCVDIEGNLSTVRKGAFTRYKPFLP